MLIHNLCGGYLKKKKESYGLICQDDLGIAKIEISLLVYTEPIIVNCVMEIKSRLLCTMFIIIIFQGDVTNILFQKPHFREY